MKKIFSLALILLVGLFCLNPAVRAQGEVPEDATKLQLAASVPAIIVYNGEVLNDSVVLTATLPPEKEGEDPKVVTNIGRGAGQIYIVLTIRRGETPVYTDTLDTPEEFNYHFAADWQDHTTGDTTVYRFSLHEVTAQGVVDWGKINRFRDIPLYRWKDAGKARWEDGQAMGISAGSYLNLYAQKDSVVLGNFHNGTRAHWYVTDPEGTVLIDDTVNTLFRYLEMTQTRKLGYYSAKIIFYRVNPDSSYTSWLDTLRGNFRVFDFKVTAPTPISVQYTKPSYFYDTMPFYGFNVPDDVEVGWEEGKHFILLEAKAAASKVVYDTLKTREKINGYLFPTALWEALSASALVSNGTKYVTFNVTLCRIDTKAADGTVTYTQLAQTTATPYIPTSYPEVQTTFDFQETYENFPASDVTVKLVNGMYDKTYGGALLKCTLTKKYVDAPVWDVYNRPAMYGYSHKVRVPALSVPGEYSLRLQLCQFKGDDTVAFPETVSIVRDFVLKPDEDDPDAPAPTVKLPSVKFTPEGGDHMAYSLNVTLAHDTAGVKIYYRKDTVGAFALYSGTAVTVTDTACIEAYARKKGYINSDTLRRVYSLREPVYVKLPSVKFTPDGGSFDTVTYVKLSHDSAAAAIYYRKDTTGAFTAYTRTDSIRLADTAYIEAYAAITEGYFINSDTIRRLFKVKETEPAPAPTPVKLASVRFSPDSGNFEDTVYVKLSHDSAAAVIYYRKGLTGAFTAYTRTDSIMLADTVILQAYAALTGCLNSDTARKVFNVKKEIPVDLDIYPVLSFYPVPAGKYEEGRDISITVKVEEGAVLRQDGPDAVNAVVKMNIYEGAGLVFSKNMLSVAAGFAEFTTDDFEDSDFDGFKKGHTYRLEAVLYHNSPNYHRVWLNEEGQPIVIGCEIEIVAAGTLPKDYDFEWMGRRRDTVNLYFGYKQLSYRFKVKENVESETPYVVICYFYHAKPENINRDSNMWVEGSILEADADGIYAFDSAYLDGYAFMDEDLSVAGNIVPGDYTLELFILTPALGGTFDMKNQWTQGITVINAEAEDDDPVIPEPVLVVPARVVMEGRLGEDGTIRTQFVVKGSNLAEDVQVPCPDGSEFNWGPNTLSAADVMSAEGAAVTAVYRGSRSLDSVQVTLTTGKLEKTLWLVAIVDTTGPGVYSEDLELQGVSVYPNPAANGRFNVKVPVRANVEIFNAAGTVVMRETAVEGLRSYELRTAGVYFVRVTAGTRSAVKRVIVR